MAKRMVPNKKAMDAVAKQAQTPKPISQIMPGKKVVKKPVQQQPAVEQPKPVELPKEEVKPEPVQEQKPSNSMVFQPISKKKNSTGMTAERNTSWEKIIAEQTAWENPNIKTIPPVLEVPAKQPENSGPGLSLDLDTIVNTVVDSMMDKFVTREEMQTLVEATIKKMILENSIKNK